MKKFSFLPILLLSLFSVHAQTVSRQQQVANISSFAKLCGYVRYFHPSDEAAAMDWDKFIYYGIREVENAESPKALKLKLNELFNPIAPAVWIGEDAQTKNFNLKAIVPPVNTGLKEITWQHFGLGNKDGLYKSARTNRSVTVLDPKRSGFGVASQSVAATAYRGKKFRLKGAMKTDVITGQGQMWMRIDLEPNGRGFFDNMDNRPVKANAWKEYEITGVVDKDAKSFVFGAFLLGEGKIWVDKFTLEIEDNGIWVAVPMKNYSFEEEGLLPKDWYAGSPGYEYSIVKSETYDDQRSLLISDNSTKEMVTSIFDRKAKYGEHFTKSIGNGLSCTVPLVLMGTENATYPVANAAKLAKLMEKLELLNISSSDPYVSLSGVITVWNVFQHFFPYKEEAKLAWNDELAPALSAAYEAKTPKAYGSVLKVLTEKLKDGHVSVQYGDQNYFSMDADAVLAEGKIVISKVDSAGSESGKLRRGDVVLMVDGVPAAERFAGLKKEISGSEQWKNNAALGQIFSGYKDTEMVLKVKNGTEAEREVRTTRKKYRQSADKTTIKKLGDNIYYINIGNTEMKDITALLPELTNAKGLICDLRGYPKSNHALISHLLSVPDTNKWMFVPRIIYPDYEKVTYDGMGWNMQPATPHINAKVIFLTGGGAISYAESYMGFIKQYKLATIVGQPTAGANGNINPFAVPGNSRVVFTGMKVKLQDGGQLHSLGIQPDVFVNQTIKGISEGRDEYLEKALEIMK
ncbi:MAG TPA: S41 family peptidase [Pedobacter sp.]|uniref:S41 family peptidase n=1 Tax=Pedobacter sp. TaxID=1411316 RepID=UPI002C67BF03|nr:S41 family peptidase [Pedobacter sp.]HMI03874.1 S41 family peptidase [Pedobacter sp.]